MKTIAVYPLHYGRDYLGRSIAALLPLVDQVIVGYTPEGSFGRKAPNHVTCPETENELRSIADAAAGKALTWIRGIWPSEGVHRNFLYDRAIAAGADLIIQCDADEIWDTSHLEECLHRASRRGERNFGIQGFVHFWRSFGWCCRDTWAPVRIINPRRTNTDQGELHGRVYHFGYAIPEALMRYKWSIHGHAAELRPEWFDKIFSAWPKRLADLHPVVKDWWNAEKFDSATLPDGLKTHAFYGLSAIR